MCGPRFQNLTLKNRHVSKMDVFRASKINLNWESVFSIKDQGTKQRLQGNRTGYKENELKP